MSPRPRLKAHARPLRRSTGSVQFGLAHELGMVIEGLTAAEVELVGRLDGTLGLPQLYDAARALGVEPARVELLLARLRDRRLLVEDSADRAELAVIRDVTPGRQAHHRLRASAEALAAAYGLGDDGFRQLAARAGQHVAIVGAGRLPATIATLLTDGGVGRVDAGEAADRLEQEAAVRTGGRDALSRPGLAVLTARGVICARDAAGWQRRAVPHLPVVCQGHRVMVGPLVRPGTGPCLHCLDLQRRERDPAWPAVLSQLMTTGPQAPTVDAETSLAATAAGLAAMLAHAHLDGLPVPVGVSLEVALPWPDVVHRAWAAHPRCPCGTSG